MLLFAVLDVDTSEIEWYDIQRKPSDEHGSGLPVYLVSFGLKGDDVTYEYEIDCQTGKVTGSDGSVLNEKRGW